VAKDIEVDDDLDLDLEIEDELPGGNSKEDPADTEAMEPLEAETDSAKDWAEDNEDANYGARVRKRIDKEVWRRKSAEEATARMRAELNALRADVEQIQSRHSVVESQAMEGQWREQMLSAQKRLKEAKETGDIDAELTASDEYADARTRLRAAEAYRQQQQQQQQPQPQTSRPSAGAVDLPAGTQAWLSKNSWFQSGAHPRAARLATELDAELQDDGYSPHDPAMYAELNRRLKAAMPKIAPVIGDIGGQRQPGPPTGASSADGHSPAPAKKRKISTADLAEMQEYGLNPHSVEDRKVWLRAHQ